jgi:hypothetical protein
MRERIKILILNISTEMNGNFFVESLREENIIGTEKRSLN